MRNKVVYGGGTYPDFPPPVSVTLTEIEGAPLAPHTRAGTFLCNTMWLPRASENESGAGGGGGGGG